MALATRISDKKRLDNGDLRLKATVVPLAGTVSIGPAKQRAKIRALGEEGILTTQEGVGSALLGRAVVENTKMHGEVSPLGVAQEIEFTIRVKS